ncbi:MAG: primosomal protein N' (replication factor Y) [Gammaproteobacteria bacterium]|jgi:primosomal protein N' (replication factor Y)
MGWIKYHDVPFRRVSVVPEKPASHFASFAIAIPLYRVFDYALDELNSAGAGKRFRLPFGSGSKTGIFLNAQDNSAVAVERTKQVLECLDEAPVLSEHMMALAYWMASYYLQPLGEVMFQCLPAHLRGSKSEKPERMKYWHALTIDDALRDTIRRRSPRQFELLVAIEQSPGGLNAVQLKHISSSGSTLIKALEQKAAIEWGYSKPQNAQPVLEQPPQSSADQLKVLEQLETRLDVFSVHLLDGITGSGKTEVYFRLIQLQLAKHKQIIYLVPEIGLTSQLVERVRRRFGEQFAISHSGLTNRQRYLAWEKFRAGDVNIMLGTRSSLFSQSERLGLIIIDEEHDSSYKQEDGIRYHARDVAIKRAQMLDIPIVLGTATPSLESLNNCDREHYYLYQLLQRPTRHSPPSIELVDTSNVKLVSGCSPYLLKKIEQHLSAKGQVLLFLNRRGFAPVVMCHECGWQADCAHCDSKLTLHHRMNSLLCHHCGYRQSMPLACPKCQHADIKHYGIGTEQLEQGLKWKFPDTSIIRIDRDSISSRDEFANRLAQIQSGEPCIIIGTQMIAKGHDYPAITLSAMLDADQALFSASYRATEQLVQMVFQVSGRSGRGEIKGEALLQTAYINHPLMQSMVDQSYRDIAATILQGRKMIGFPPFARVVMFRADAMNLGEAMEKLAQIKQCLQTSAKIKALTCIGPIPALMTRRIGRYRAQLCLLSRDTAKLRAALREAMPALQSVKNSQTVKWVIDVDAFDL